MFQAPSAIPRDVVLSAWSEWAQHPHSHIPTHGKGLQEEAEQLPLKDVT